MLIYKPITLLHVAYTTQPSARQIINIHKALFSFPFVLLIIGIVLWIRVQTNQTFITTNEK